MRFEPINPEALGAPRGFNHGMLAPSGGRLLFVAGQTALGDDGRIIDGGFVAQFERALERVVAVVEAAGGTPESIGRMMVYVTSRADYLANLKLVGEAYRRVMGKHYPAMALVEVAALVDEGAVVEVEATAVVP